MNFKYVHIKVCSFFTFVPSILNNQLDECNENMPYIFLLRQPILINILIDIQNNFNNFYHYLLFSDVYWSITTGSLGEQAEL